VAAAWEPAEGTTFSVRSLNYMRTKIKEPSGPCIYRCVGGRAGGGAALWTSSTAGLVLPHVMCVCRGTRAGREVHLCPWSEALQVAAGRLERQLSCVRLGWAGQHTSCSCTPARPPLTAGRCGALAGWLMCGQAGNPDHLL